MSFIPGGGGGGGGSGGGGSGTQQLTLASDTISLSGNGGSVVVGTAQSVATNTANIATNTANIATNTTNIATNTQKLTAQTFDPAGGGSAATNFASDVVVGVGGQLNNLFVSNLSRTRYLSTAYLYDGQSSIGTEGQVLSIAPNGNLLWATPTVPPPGQYYATSAVSSIALNGVPGQTVSLFFPSGLAWVAGDTAVITWTTDTSRHFQATVQSYQADLGYMILNNITNVVGDWSQPLSQFFDINTVNPQQVQRLTLSADTITLSGGGGSVVVGSAQSVVDNTANIATNTTNIATNTANIATNTANIATNTTKLTAQTFQSGGGIITDATLFTSDVVVGAVGNTKVLTVNGSVRPTSIADVNGSLGGGVGNVLSVDVSNQLVWTAPPNSKAFSYNFYVSNATGSDVITAGTIGNPFQTITYALSRLPLNEAIPCIINLACGTYTENLSITRNNVYLVGGSTSLSVATQINGSISWDATGSALATIIGGISSITFTNLIYNNANPKDQTLVITDCIITSASGVSAIVATDASTPPSPAQPGFGSITIQNSVIYGLTTIPVNIGGTCSLSFVNSQITNFPGTTANISMIQTTGAGRVNLFGCSVISNTTATISVAPIILITNTLANSNGMTINSSILQYTSSAVDTSGLTKCCISFANSALLGTTNSPVNLIYTQLICEGARATNSGSGSLYLAIQKSGAGTTTFKHGNNVCGATANHLPTAFANTAWVALGN